MAFSSRADRKVPPALLWQFIPQVVEACPGAPREKAANEPPAGLGRRLARAEWDWCEFV
jgi:hypothetical protein